MVSVARKVKTSARGRGGRKPGKWTWVTPGEIRAYRERTGSSRAALAQELGVSTTSVQNWESGKVASSKIQQRLRALMDGDPLPRPNGEARRVTPPNGGDRAAIGTTGAIVAAYLETQHNFRPDQLPELVRRVRHALLS